jgi:hypothetical protein
VQGNAPKLVYTPLTDKCYLTLTQVKKPWRVGALLVRGQRHLASRLEGQGGPIHRLLSLSAFLKNTFALSVSPYLWPPPLMF